MGKAGSGGKPCVLPQPATWPTRVQEGPGSAHSGTRGHTVFFTFVSMNNHWCRILGGIQVAIIEKKKTILSYSPASPLNYTGMSSACMHTHYTYMCTYTCIFMYIHMHTCMHTHVYIYMYKNTHTNTFGFCSTED